MLILTRIEGRLSVPSESRPMAFGDYGVVLRATDADDIVSLRVHRIVAAP